MLLKLDDGAVVLLELLLWNGDFDCNIYHFGCWTSQDGEATAQSK